MKMTRATGILTIAAILLLGTQVWADGEKIDGRYRIHYYSGRNVASIEGDVKEVDDSYQITTKYGAIVTIPKNRVKAIVSLEELEARERSTAENNPDSQLRPSISDEEIEEILMGIEADADEADLGVTAEDLMAPLDLDVDSLRDMMRNCGLEWDEDKPPEEQENVLIRPHFTMVYTSSIASARQLGARLESVWKWNVKFVDILGIPARRPEHKLELFYFGKHEEFVAYANRTGGSADAAGYYTPKDNRSHFFDFGTHPYVVGFLAHFDRPGVPPDTRRIARNKAARYVEYQNMEVIQHETGHHIHFNIGLFPRNGLERESSIPIWLVEGTTMMFEIPPSSQGGSLGMMNHTRLHNLRRERGPHPLSAPEWKLFLIDNNLWYNGMGGGNPYYSYQLGWSMVYYLWKEHRDQYAQYLRIVFGRDEDFRMTNTEREKEFEDIFGDVNEDWINRYYTFLDSLVVKPSLLPPELR